MLLLIVAVGLVLAGRAFDFAWWRDTAQVVLTPVTRGFYRAGFEANRAVRFVASLPTARQDNLQLTRQVEDLSTDLVELDRLRQENEALRGQLGVEGVRTEKKVLATVLGLEDDGSAVRLIVDRGRDDGVEEGQAAIEGARLIGQVVRAELGHAYIRPIFSVNGAVPVEVVRAELADSSTRGVVRGHFNERIVLTEVMHGRELGVGDLVVTSGEGGVYPPGLLVGRVEAVESNDHEIFQTARLTPFWRLDEVRTVFVLVE